MLSIDAQRKPCGPGEAYRPTSVDIVLGRKDVMLRDSSGHVVARGPTASDLWHHAKGGYYIDLPGDPLDPGCGYEKQFRAWNDGRKPRVYAHVATDPAYPGRLAVEYWFYYTFNDFTDLHESDWEMAQVDFEATNAAEALLKGPYEVDVAQHAGGERSAWTDTKLDRQGTHPVIYAATGSHADYFGRALYLGRGAREGFGCDDTRNATARLQLADGAAAQRSLVRNRPVRLARIRGALGSEGERHQQRPHGTRLQTTMVSTDRVGGGLRNTSIEVPSGTRSV